MQQQSVPRTHYSFLRRLFFPYSGERALTRSEQRRVIFTWVAIFPVVLYLCTLPVIVMLSGDLSLRMLFLTSLLILLGGVVIFTGMACLVLWTVNRTVRQVQQRGASQGQSASSSNSSGGSYGS